ncbi:hypothetical protein NP493_11g14061 [Ridgeia piscesae]|uniref:VTT domain-containing protein n=1 Tax=Ridgeia piscesae TaxID=27915 RepID=A0AAD9PFI9_RIDPI|nr:hypothetical protein NP493_11g14061 [Ridgeia piscesae]
MDWMRSVLWFRVDKPYWDDAEKQPLSPDLILNDDGDVKKSRIDGDDAKHEVTTAVTQARELREDVNNDDIETSKLLDKENEPSCLSISLYSAIAIAFICVFLVVLRGYVKYVLLSLEETDLWVSFIVFSILFTVVSFPLTWGYILLNIAAGYLYGLCLGVFVVMTCALCGLSIAHVIIRKFLAKCIMARINNHSVRAIMRVIDSGHGFRVVVLSRLTPIPFGLQNGLFAVSNITTSRYIMASMVGMFPSQGMHAYIGSTLRSMEEVISSSSGSSFTAYIIFIGQLLMAVALLTFVIRRAKVELNKTVQGLDDRHGQGHDSDPFLPSEKGSHGNGVVIVNVHKPTALKRHSPSNSLAGQTVLL